MTQSTLDDLFVKDRIEEAFEKFDSEHPIVYRELVRLARVWRSHGTAKLGIAILFERLRWEWHVSGLRDAEGFKLNNNFRALYARKIMAENPDLDGIFELRERTTKRFIY